MRGMEFFDTSTTAENVVFTCGIKADNIEEFS